MKQKLSNKKLFLLLEMVPPPPRWIYTQIYRLLPTAHTLVSAHPSLSPRDVFVHRYTVFYLITTHSLSKFALWAFLREMIASSHILLITHCFACTPIQKLNRPHCFLSVNARLLIAFGTAFYAITLLHPSMTMPGAFTKILLALILFILWNEHFLGGRFTSFFWPYLTVCLQGSHTPFWEWGRGL